MKKHERIKIMNITVFGCNITKEAYDTNMPFRFCPSCGDRIDEDESTIKRILSQ